MDEREFERLYSKFGWFIHEDCPPFATAVICRPEPEIAVLWDGRRRCGKELRRLGLVTVYERIRAEADRRQRIENRWYSSGRTQAEFMRAQLWRPRTNFAARVRTLPIRPTPLGGRRGRAPRSRRIRVRSGSRGDPSSRSSADDPDPAAVAASCRWEAA
jgi:hypothetical protein